MKTDEGTTDRGLRIGAGLAFIGLAATGVACFRPPSYGGAMLEGREWMARPEMVG